MLLKFRRTKFTIQYIFGFCCMKLFEFLLARTCRDPPLNIIKNQYDMLKTSYYYYYYYCC